MYTEEMLKSEYSKVLSNKYNDFIYCVCPYVFYKDIREIGNFKYDYDTGLCRTKDLTFEKYRKVMRYQGVIFQRPSTIIQYRDKQRAKNIKYK